MKYAAMMPYEASQMYPRLEATKSPPKKRMIEAERRHGDAAAMLIHLEAVIDDGAEKENEKCDRGDEYRVQDCLYLALILIRLFWPDKRDDALGRRTSSSRDFFRDPYYARGIIAVPRSEILRYRCFLHGVCAWL